MNRCLIALALIFLAAPVTAQTTKWANAGWYVIAIDAYYGSTNLPSPTEAQAPPVSRLCGFEKKIGGGADTSYPRRNESRVEIDLRRGSVRFTSPGSGSWLEPNEASVSNSTISWWIGTPDGTQKISYSIDRASGTYSSRLTFGGNTEQHGSQGSCLPKEPF